MSMYGVRLDRFSTIDDLSKKQLADDETVLAVLRKSPRVSTFEMSESKHVRGAISRLLMRGRIAYNNKEAYPWHGITVLPADRGGA